MFFNSKGLIYSHIIPRGSVVNEKGIVKALDNFLKQLKKKKPVMVEQEWGFYRYNVLVHEWFAAHNIQQLEYLPYSPDLAPCDFLLIRRVKEDPAGRFLVEGPQDDLGRRSNEHCHR